MSRESSPSPHALPPALFQLTEFKAQLESGDLIPCCKAAIAQASAYLDNKFVEEVEARELLTLRAKFMDNLLGALWDHINWQNAELALVAVGGYGRGELHPKSDIDLLILRGENCADCDELLGNFLTQLWDIGLDIGHSVRTVKECVDIVNLQIPNTIWSPM